MKRQETADLNDDLSMTFLDDAVAFGCHKGLRTGTAEPSLDMPFWEGFWNPLPGLPFSSNFSLFWGPGLSNS